MGTPVEAVNGPCRHFLHSSAHTRRRNRTMDNKASSEDQPKLNDPEKTRVQEANRNFSLERRKGPAETSHALEDEDDDQ